MSAESIRKFFDALFPHRVVLQLSRGLENEQRNSRERIAALERERDYFRGRAERLELRLFPDPASKPKREPPKEVPGRAQRWVEVQQEHARQNRAAEEREAKERQDKHQRIDQPKSFENDAGSPGQASLITS